MITITPIAIVVSALTTFVITPYIMKFLSAAGVVGLDMHKKNKPKLPASGGICVGLGIVAGLLTYVGLQTFVYPSISKNLIFHVLAVISTVLIVTFVGLVDDLNVSSKKVRTKDGRNVKVGLPQWIKPLLTLPAAIPLMVINAGVTSMAIPLIGDVELGILYPLLVIPFTVVFLSNAVNLLGGFNGVESGMGIVYFVALGAYGLFNESISAPIFLISAASLIGFIKYNWYPAKILPGDSLTYLLGSVVAAGAIVGNIERAAVVVMIPFLAEFLLKFRSRFKASCLGKLRKDGKLDAPYGKKIYSLTHIIMNIRPFREIDVTLLLILIEVLVCVPIFLII